MSSTASFSAHAQRPAPCNVSTDANLLIYTMLSELMIRDSQMRIWLERIRLVILIKAI